MLVSRNFMAAHGTVRYRLRKKKCSAIGMLAAAAPHNMAGARKPINFSGLRVTSGDSEFSYQPHALPPGQILRQSLCQRPGRVHEYVITAILFTAGLQILHVFSQGPNISRTNELWPG